MADATLFRKMYGGEDETAWAIVFDSVLVEDHTQECEITDSPVETGAFISDHKIRRPAKLSITAAVSDIAPVGRGSDSFSMGGISRSRQAFATLLRLLGSPEWFTIQTGLKLYERMNIVSIRASQDKDTSAIGRFTIDMKEVIVVSTQTVIYPAKERKAKLTAATKKHDGEKEGTDPTEKQKSKVSFIKGIYNRYSGAGQ